MQEEVNQSDCLSIQGSQDHCQCAKSSPSEVPGKWTTVGNRKQTQVKKKKMAEKTGRAQEKGRNKPERLKRKSHMESRPSSS